MRAILIGEKQLNQQFELTAGRIAGSVIDQRAADPVVLKTTVLAHLEQLKAAIRDGGL